jgi:RimJ/RimL family protein N-acetyltransferase
MFLLEKNYYSKAKPLFNKMLGYETSIIGVFNGNEHHRLYVDDMENPEICFVIMDWSFCYFGGKYNEKFINTCLNHTFAKPGFYPIFAEIKLLTDIKNINFPDKPENSIGKRLYYKLNTEKFLQNKLSFRELPENYEIILDIENREQRTVLIYNGKESGHCVGHYDRDYHTAAEISFDVFLEEEHRNKGIGPLLCAKLIDYHISQNHGNAVSWGCFCVNIPSAKCAEKLGFDLISEDKIIYHFV